MVIEQIEKLLRVNRPAAARMLMRRGIRPSDVDDVIQDSNIKALTNLDTLKDGMAFKPWYWMILKLTSIDFARREYRKGSVSFDDIDSFAIDGLVAIETKQFNDSDSRLMLKILIEGMDDYPGRLLTSRRLGMTHQEVADSLGAGLPGVKTAYNRAVADLRRRVQTR